MWSLHNFDVDEFLAEYWQQKPLLIRQALPDFQNILSPEELAGLACEDGVHARLVIEKDAEQPWQLRYGPFQEQDFTSLPQTHYSLLVSECEKWIPELQDLIREFSFIPRWRIDDLMISYAPEHGSVGPHIDEYDVFLIQANGRRRWSIMNDMQQSPQLIPDLDLAIMSDYHEDQAWVLEPGDLLYLPPRIAHHGVAVGDGCMTWSVGFRAQTTADVMDSLLFEASEHKLTDVRYADPPLDTARDPAEITARELQQFKAMVQSLVDSKNVIWADVVGKLVSDSSLSEDVESKHCDCYEEATDQIWQKHPDARFVYHRAESGLRFYHNGQLSEIKDSAQHRDLCSLLGRETVFSFEDIELSDQAQKLLLTLINSSALIPVLDEDDG